MKIKLLAVMFLAGGSMFAQPRFSVGVGVGGYGGGVYQQPLPYAAPCPPYYIWDDAYGYCVQAYAQPYYYGGGYYGGYSGGYYGGYNRYGYDNRRFEQRGVSRGFAPNRNRGGGQSFNGGRNFGGQNGNQSRGFSQRQSGGNRGGSGGQRSGGQGSRNGSRGR